MTNFFKISKSGDFGAFLPKNALHLVTLDFFVALQKFAARRKKEKDCKCLYLTNYSITSISN
jgi:hypothetical protein